MSFSAEHLCLILVKTVKHAGLREVQLSTHVCFCFCFNLCPVECTKLTFELLHVHVCARPVKAGAAKQCWEMKA